MSAYAILSEDLSTVIGLVDKDDAAMAALAAAQNPKALRYRKVTDVPPPPVTAGTQKAVPSGWTISASDVQAVWTIVALSPDEQAVYQNQQTTRATLAYQDLQTALANWPPNATQQLQLLKRLTQVTVALIQQARTG
jgi:hypothetical protein